MELKTIFWEITKDCNLKCKHCYLGKRDTNSKQYLSKERSLNYVDYLYKGGVKIVLLMGGEPLLYPFVNEVVVKGGEAGYGMHVAVLTNGVLLNNEMINKLEKSRVSAIQISIDGLDSVYKKVRGVDFRIIDENIQNLKKSKIPILAKFTLNNQNLASFENVLEYCQHNDIHLSLSLAIKIGNAGKDLIPSPNDYFKFFEKIFLLKKENQIDLTLPDFSIEQYLRDGRPKIACGGGRGVAGITKDNKFVPCIYLSGLDVEHLFGVAAPDFGEDFLEIFEKHQLFVLFRQESSRFYGCPIRRRIYKGKDPFSVYEFAKYFKNKAV